MNIFEKIEIGTYGSLGLVHLIANSGLIQFLAVVGVIATVLVSQYIKSISYNR